jgi:hypothetical protein
MSEEELENWENVQYRIDEEGFEYCFKHYSSWEEIKDEKFHQMTLEVLKQMEELINYIDLKVTEGQNKNKNIINDNQ